MLLHDSRRSTRVDDGGGSSCSRTKDRSQWDTAKIAEGTAPVDAPWPRRAGCLRHQAAIAALRAGPSADATDWAQIASSTPCRPRPSSPVVELNRAVAVAMAGGLSVARHAREAGGRAELASYHPRRRRAEILRRLGRGQGCGGQHRRALTPPRTPPKRYPQRRLASRVLSPWVRIPGARRGRAGGHGVVARMQA
jgi:RNA polymerase sigma-70 factor (ECF subfamily)